jgi:hypothetical protein
MMNNAQYLIASRRLILSFVAILVFLTPAAGVAQPSVKQRSKLPPVPAPKCLKWTERVVPFNLVLPTTFASGCGYYIPLGGNNEATVSYVLKNGVNPNLPAQLGELTPKFERQLDTLVEKAQALKILQYSPNTIGSQKLLENIPQDLVFVDDAGNLCKRFDRPVVCLDSPALTTRQLVQVLKPRPERPRLPISPPVGLPSRKQLSRGGS